MLSLSRLVPVALRHLDAYKDIAEKEAQDAITALAGRATVAMIAIGAGMFAVSMLCVSVIAATWDGPYRIWTPAALAALFALGAVLARRELVRYRAGNATLFPRLRRELLADRELLKRSLSSGLPTHANPVTTS